MCMKKKTYPVVLFVIQKHLDTSERCISIRSAPRHYPKSQRLESDVLFCVKEKKKVHVRFINLA